MLTGGKMEKSVEIKELKLKLGKKEVTLTIEEARRLKKALEEVFGKEIIREEHIHHDHYPYHWYWYKPYWVGNELTYTDNAGNIREDWIVQCDNGATFECKDNVATLSIC